MRAVNEDLALESATLYAVADGMGGHAGGEIASRVAIDALKAGFIRQPTVNGLVEAIEGANAAVWERGRDDPALRGMGTTMTAAALVGTDDGDRLVLANVGDSRTYRFHHGALEQLTTDHSVAEELVARGELSEAEAQYHPHRHILTRALGVSPAVDVDIWELEPQVGDRYLLCSDGLSNEVSAHRIETLLSTTADPQDASEALVHEANRAGGNDNITAVVLDVVLADDGPAGVAGAARAEDKGVVAPGTAPLSPAAAEQGAAVVSPSALVAKSTLSGKRSPRNVGDGSRRVRGPRRVTLRVLLFLVVLGAVAYGAWALIRWYVDGSYYVGLEQSQVVIFQGRPGGFVGLEPKVINRTGVTTAEIKNSDVTTMLQTGVQEPSRKAAEAYVSQLKQVVCANTALPSAAACAAPTTPTTTVTSVPATTAPSPAAIGARHDGAVATPLALALSVRGAHRSKSERPCGYCRTSNNEARALARPVARRRLWPA